ncbi:MAG: hypothetical protein ABSC22_03300 [Roseiarcus sp.]|jgi:hypothetical protein
MADPPADKIDWQKILDNQSADERAFAGRMSDSARFVWVGTLGLFYSAMLTASGPLADFFHDYRGWLLLAAELGAAAFVFDMIKNWAGREQSHVMQEWLRERSSQLQSAKLVDEYNAKVFTATFLGVNCQLLNRYMFTLSILASLAAAAILGGSVAAYYFSPPPTATVAAPAVPPAK